VTPRLREADVEVEDVALPLGERRRGLVRIFRPADSMGALPAVLYLGAQGAAGDQLARELAAGVPAAVLVPDDDLAGQLTAGRELLRWIVAEGARRRLDGSRLALIGDRAAAELALLTSDDDGPPLRTQAMLRPVLSDGQAAGLGVFLASALS
jgi:acetyl esterase/lipase